MSKRPTTQITLLERGSRYFAALNTAKRIMQRKNNWKDSGPDEIRTHDPRRVKASTDTALIENMQLFQQQ
ncbi:hypothetical protein [Methanomethylovorans sp.]|uniref:hypothetical protein n=1 Tax=Methanomethylovorans sp. TaxID=2758717 RepID=UPI00351C73FA